MEEEHPKSRTQKKKEDRALQRLGEELLTISMDQLAAITMPEELAEAVRLGRQTTQHGARRRQLQYIGALMRQIDSTPIKKALDNIRQGDYQKELAFKKDRAVAGYIERRGSVDRRGHSGRMPGSRTATSDATRSQCPQGSRHRQNGQGVADLVSLFAPGIRCIILPRAAYHKRWCAISAKKNGPRRWHND
jgi:hypothetical protein